MFDIGFSEILVIAVVALIVIGPERLPKTARTLGHLFGRLQRYVNEVKADINREMEIEELRKLQQEVQTAARDIETSISTAAREVESGVRAVESDLNAAAAGTASAAPAADAAPEMQPLPAAEPASPAPPAAGTSVAAGAQEAAEPPRQPSLPGFERG
jgi:sec-independent protein translocase protein TatB